MSSASAYELDDPIEVKIEKIARQVYGAAGIESERRGQAHVSALRRRGLDRPAGLHGEDAALAVPRSDGPERARGFTLPVREIRPYTGAGWLVVLCGDLMTMPGLSAHPAALDIDIDQHGRTVGLR